MNKATRTHIRSLLWQYKQIKKNLEDFSDVLLNDQAIVLDYPLTKSSSQWSLNQIVFHRMFLQVVSDILAEATSDIQDIFQSKYVRGFPTKDNAIVAVETYVSESTVKRRDNEFLKEIANRLGWLSV